jgi:multidrug efflux pump subunit AcrA (membrane-fusion protein)
MKQFGLIILSLAFTIMGLAGGWYASRQTASGTAGVREPEARDANEGKKPEKGKPLSQQAQKNLGVEVAAIETTSYARLQHVTAVVTDTSTTRQPVVAPVGGTLSDILIVPGTTVKGGQPLFRMIREPIARPSLVLTDHVIQPATDEVHVAYGELRRALRGLEVLETELRRIGQFTKQGDGVPIVPRKVEIDLEYDVARAKQDVDNAREKLRLHGFSDEQIGQVEKGKSPTVVDSSVWKRGLERNGLWSALCERIHKVLPEALRATPWAVATLGELSGSGLVSEDLAVWLEREAKAAADLLIIASMLQQGHSLQEIRTLHAQNALAPVVDIQAPVLGEESWDVGEVLVRPTERVAAGTRLATLVDSRELLIKAEPVGGETAAILKAYEAGREIEAVPAVEGDGPKLSGLKIAYLSSDEHSGMVAHLHVKNALLRVTDEGSRGTFRSWRLRSGQRYILRIPREVFAEVFALPGDAVVDDGPDKVVFVQDGDTFEPRKVVVLYQDHDSVVLDGKHSDLFPGDMVVKRGAFALSMALKSGTGGAVDPHAGHNH